MLIGRRLFISSAVFAIVLATAYWQIAHEIAGTFLLGFMAFALVFLAGYMIVSEREADFWGDDKSAGKPDASEHADGVGTLIGTYTIRSPLPICAAFAVTTALLGIVISPTLAIVSLIAVLTLGALFIIQSR
jgi:hypothetical protein